MNVTMERLFEIWNDDTGERIDVGPDRDGLELVEIRAREQDGTIRDRITLTREQAALVAQALLELTRGES